MMIIAAHLLFRPSTLIQIQVKATTRTRVEVSSHLINRTIRVLDMINNKITIIIRTTTMVIRTIMAINMEITETQETRTTSSQINMVRLLQDKVTITTKVATAAAMPRLLLLSASGAHEQCRGARAAADDAREHVDSALTRRRGLRGHLVHAAFHPCPSALGCRRRCKRANWFFELLFGFHDRRARFLRRVMGVLSATSRCALLRM